MTLALGVRTPTGQQHPALRQIRKIAIPELNIGLGHARHIKQTDPLVGTIPG